MHLTKGSCHSGWKSWIWITGAPKQLQGASTDPGCSTWGSTLKICSTDSPTLGYPGGYHCPLLYVCSFCCCMHLKSVCLHGSLPHHVTRLVLSSWSPPLLSLEPNKDVGTDKLLTIILEKLKRVLSWTKA